MTAPLASWASRGRTGSASATRGRRRRLFVDRSVDRHPRATAATRDRLATLVPMSAERDELKRLVEELPDERVNAVLAQVRRQQEPQAEADWPPPWFASFASGRHDLGSNHDDLLAEGFGRS